MEKRQEGLRYHWVLLTFLMSGMWLHDQIAYLYNQAMLCSTSEDRSHPCSFLIWPGEDSFDIRFGDEFESKHPLTWASKEENLTSGKWSYPFPLPRSSCGLSVMLQGRRHKKEKTHLARSLLRRVFPPNPSWWLPKALKHDIACSCLRMIGPMWAILFFPGPWRKVLHTCKCRLPS